MNLDLGFEVTLNQPYPQAVESVVNALKTEGFGVLTRIDVRATLQEKLGAEFRPYIILGACNPPLAQRALTADARAGLLLPCNVTVEELSDGGSLVRIVNPLAMMLVGDLGEIAALRDVAATAYQKLARVTDTLRS